MTVFELQDALKLISRKIWMAGKFKTFHSVFQDGLVIKKCARYNTVSPILNTSNPIEIRSDPNISIAPFWENPIFLIFSTKIWLKMGIWEAKKQFFSFTADTIHSRPSKLIFVLQYVMSQRTFTKQVLL